MSVENPTTSERREPLPVSTRIHVLSALRRLMEKPDFGEKWKPMRLGQEMWELTPELRHQYRGDFGYFWSLNQRRLPHILDGDYDKLDDVHLHMGLRNFLERNFPDALEVAAPKRTRAVIDLATSLDDFYCGEPLSRGFDTPARDEPVLYGFSNGLHAPERHRNCFFAYRKVTGRDQCTAVLFSTTNARLRFEGFLIPRMGIAMFRGVDCAGEVVYFAIDPLSGSASSMACRLVQRTRSMTGYESPISIFPTLDREALKAATVLLNNLDKSDGGG